MRNFKYLSLAVGSILLAGSVFASPVDINSASAVSLAENIQGIGPKLAQAVVDYRKENGPFLAVEHLMGVKGHLRKFLLFSLLWYRHWYFRLEHNWWWGV